MIRLFLAFCYKVLLEDSLFEARQSVDRSAIKRTTLPDYAGIPLPPASGEASERAASEAPEEALGEEEAEGSSKTRHGRAYSATPGLQAPKKEKARLMLEVGGLSF